MYWSIIPWLRRCPTGGQEVHELTGWRTTPFAGYLPLRFFRIITTVNIILMAAVIKNRPTNVQVTDKKVSLIFFLAENLSRTWGTTWNQKLCSCKKRSDVISTKSVGKCNQLAYRFPEINARFSATEIEIEVRYTITGRGYSRPNRFSIQRTWSMLHRISTFTKSG